MTDNYSNTNESQEKITTREGIHQLKTTLERYISVLEKIIDIKAQNPVTPNTAFIRKKSGSSVDVLNNLLNISANLLHEVFEIENSLQHKDLRDPKRENSPELNEELIHALDNTIMSCKNIYAGQAQSFAILLNDLTSIAQQFHQRMLFSDHSAEALTGNKTSFLQRIPKESEEEKKLVYIRVYHRELSKLSHGKKGLTFLKPLIEMIKYSEKHGLAVYEEEAFAKKSLKTDSYGYFTVEISLYQDISSERHPKRDPVLECSLLTLTKIEPQQLKKFTHNKIDYPITGGMMTGFGE